MMSKKQKTLFMEKISIELLKLYNKRQSLSIYDVSIIKNTGLTSMGPPVRELIDSKYIVSSFSTEFDPAVGVPIDAQFRISQAGKSYLYELEVSQNEKTKKYRLDKAAIIISVFALAIAATSLLVRILK